MLGRLPFIIVVSLFAFVVAAAFVEAYSTTEYTCLECRATLAKRRICGVPISRTSAPHSYTADYLATHPSHLHSWRWCGTRQSWSLFTHTRACGRQHPIWSLPVAIQSEYSRLVSPSEMDATLAEIDSGDHARASAAMEKAFIRVFDSR